MTTNRTFTMVKPDAVESGNAGAILKMIEEGGFRIVPWGEIIDYL